MMMLLKSLAFFGVRVDFFAGFFVLALSPPARLHPPTNTPTSLSPTPSVPHRISHLVLVSPPAPSSSRQRDTDVAQKILLWRTLLTWSNRHHCGKDLQLPTIVRTMMHKQAVCGRRHPCFHRPCNFRRDIHYR